jgi:hypothetical protein
MGNQVIIVCGILVGFLIVPMAAGAAPEIVNGLLLLMLAGAVLMNSSKWIPSLASFGNAISAAPPAPTGGGGGGSVKAT